MATMKSIYKEFESQTPSVENVAKTLRALKACNDCHQVIKGNFFQWEFGKIEKLLETLEYGSGQVDVWTDGKNYLFYVKSKQALTMHYSLNVEFSIQQTQHNVSN